MLSKKLWFSALGASSLALLACSPMKTGIIPSLSPSNVRPQPTGGVLFSVAWPHRNAQLIPNGTTHLSIVAYQGGSPVKQTSIVSPTSTGSLQPLAVGTYTLTALAQDASNTVLASGSTSVAITANALVPAALTLSALVNPVLSSMSQTNGIPGDWVTLTGTGFGASGALPFSVYVAGASASATRLSDTNLTFQIPTGAGNGPVVLNVASSSVQSTASFTTIASLSIGAAPASVTRPATVNYAVTALDSKSNPVANPIVKWNLEGQKCTANCLSAPTLGSIGPSTGVYTTDSEAGSLVVRVGNAGTVTATTSLIVN